MKKKSLILVLVLLLMSLGGWSGCGEDSAAEKDTAATVNATEKLIENQQTPQDITFSLSRYNLIRRAYYINGGKEKANEVKCDIEKQVGYLREYSYGTLVNEYRVDGIVTSLQTYLTADSEYYEKSTGSSGIIYNDWVPDIDGTFGENQEGIFFFDTAGEYHEWNGEYEFSSCPFEK